MDSKAPTFSSGPKPDTPNNPTNGSKACRGHLFSRLSYRISSKEDAKNGTTIRFRKV